MSEGKIGLEQNINISSKSYRFKAKEYCGHVGKKMVTY